jgi:hypothetical protein
MEYAVILRKIVLFRRYVLNQTELNHTKPRLFDPHGICRHTQEDCPHPQVCSL